MVGRVEEQETNIFRESHTRSPIAAVASKNNSQHWKQVVAGKLGGENNSTGDTGSGDIALKMRPPIFSFLQQWYSRPVWLKFAAKFPVFLGNGCVWFSFEQIGGFSESLLRPVVTMVETETTPQSSFPGMESGRIASPDGLAAKCESFSENRRRSCWISIKIWIVFFARERGDQTLFRLRPQTLNI